MEPVSEQKPMKMYYMVSIFIHAAIVGIILLTCASGIEKTPETITIVLNNEAFMAGSSGGDDKIQGSQAMKNIEKTISRETPKVKSNNKAILTSKNEEVINKTVLKEAEKNNVIPSNESSELALLGKPLQSNTDFDSKESGAGAGGGGSGSSGYGSGSGFGGRGSGGTGGDGKGYGSGQSKENKRMMYLKEHFSYIRELIMKNITYPTQARRMGWKGQVTVSFIISEKGNVEDIRIIKSSGYKILDDNVTLTIKEVQPFPKPPVRAEIVIPVMYTPG
jgi:periplasmic protein TonB